MPRTASQASSGAAQRPSLFTNSLTGSTSSELPTTAPAKRSWWPPRNLVALCTTRSAPFRKKNSCPLEEIHKLGSQERSPELCLDASDTAASDRLARIDVRFEGPKLDHVNLGRIL